MAADQTRTKRRPYRLSLAQYEDMGRLGVLTPADRVELLDGLLVEKMTKGPRHENAKHRVYKALEAARPVGAGSLASRHVRMESPVRLPRPRHRASEPEPDVAVIRGPLSSYEDHLPGPDDVILIVEIADSSVGDDRAGLSRYARHGIPCVWVVNIPEEHVEVFTSPVGRNKSARYEEREVKDRRATLALLLDGEACPVPVAGFFA